MADWAKRARRALNGQLGPGETVVAAALLQPDDTMGVTAARGAGGAIGSAIYRHRHPATDGDLANDWGIAATLGATAFYGVLTQHRFLVMDQSGLSGRPNGMRAVLRRSDIAGFDVIEESLADRVLITFADGTGRRLEAPGRAARELAAALFPTR
jgi:hypothetical protein